MPAHWARPDLYGAQPERTALAWQRSLLSVQLGSLLLVVTAVREGSWVFAVLGAVLSVAVGWSLVLRGPLSGGRGGSAARAPADEGVAGAGSSAGSTGAQRAPRAASHGLVRLVLAVGALGVLGAGLSLARVIGAA